MLLALQRSGENKRKKKCNNMRKEEWECGEAKEPALREIRREMLKETE